MRTRALHRAGEWKGMEMADKVIININQRFVKQDIPFTDPQTGEERTFHSVKVPNGTILDGRDIGGATFSPLFVDDNRQ